jgi:hypothetical protein
MVLSIFDLFFPNAVWLILVQALISLEVSLPLTLMNTWGKKVFLNFDAFGKPSNDNISDPFLVIPADLRIKACFAATATNEYISVVPHVEGVNLSPTSRVMCTSYHLKLLLLQSNFCSRSRTVS